MYYVNYRPGNIVENSVIHIPSGFELKTRCRRGHDAKTDGLDLAELAAEHHASFATKRRKPRVRFAPDCHAKRIA